jgi:putative transposase
MSRNREAVRCDDQLMHITNRGVDRNLLFFCPADYLFFLELVADCLDPANIAIHAFTLMPNHFHLILWQRLAYDVSKFMHKVCGEYARVINRKRPRVGHLYQDRYKADPVFDEASLLRLSHYIHQNPVRANLVASPEDWQYGSMREYAGLVPPRFTDLDRLTKLVGGRDAYIEFMKSYDSGDPGSAWTYLV